MTIKQYIASNPECKIVKRAKNPLMWIIITLVGIALIVLTYSANLGDTLSTALLTIGAMVTVVGLVIVVLCLTKAMTQYVHVPTSMVMKERYYYLTSDNYQKYVAILSSDTPTDLSEIEYITSSTYALHTFIRRDKKLSIVQAGRYDVGHFEPQTPVIMIDGTEFAVKEMTQ